MHHSTAIRTGTTVHSPCTCKDIKPPELINGKYSIVTPFHYSYSPRIDVGMINDNVTIDKQDGGCYISELMFLKMLRES